MPPSNSREYARNTDVGPEDQIIIPKGDQMDREIANLREWMRDLDTKVDALITEGCSHRGNDLAKLSRIEAATDGFRIEAGAIKDSIYQLSLSFEQHKTKVVESTNFTNNKISNLKLGILAQCTLLLLVILGFLFKEFVIPATKNISSPSLITDKDHINIDQETWDKLIKNKK